MRVAYVSASAPNDLKSWSGTIYYLGRALEQQGVEMDYLGPFGVDLTLLFRAKNWFYSRILGKGFLADRDPLFVSSYARQTAAALVGSKAELILCTHTEVLAGFEDSRPIVYWTDSCFGGMKDFYPYFKNLCGETTRNGFAMERLALQRCALAIYSSDWAAQTAIQHHGVDPKKVKVVPYGANIVCKRTLANVRQMINARPAEVCKLLFIGRIWDRKGGDTVVAVAKRLNHLGLRTELTLVGSGPPDEIDLPSFIKSLGYVDKATPAGKQMLDSLLAESHFLFVPSRAEAFGIVFCEASSFGVPSLSSNVGGITTVVRDGVNGRTFAPSVAIDDYCDYIRHLMEHYGEYQKLALSAFQEYETRLNWRVAAGTVKRLLEEVLRSAA